MSSPLNLDAPVMALILPASTCACQPEFLQKNGTGKNPAPLFLNLATA
jgi:hypothetical protein